MAHIQSIQTFQKFNENIERHIIPSDKAQPETKIRILYHILVSITLIYKLSSLIFHK